MHIWSLQPFSQGNDLASHTIVCFNFIHEWRVVRFKFDCERRICGEVFNAILFYLKSFCLKSTERKSTKKYFIIFGFVRHIWPGRWSSRLINQRTTYWTTEITVIAIWNIKFRAKEVYYHPQIRPLYWKLARKFNIRSYILDINRWLLY